MLRSTFIILWILIKICFMARIYLKCLAVCFMAIFIVSCSHTKSWQGINDIWIGSHQIADRTIPYPWILAKINKKWYLIDHHGVKQDSCNVGPLQKGDTLLMHNHPFSILYKDDAILNIFQLNDTINFPFVKGKMNWKYRAQLVPTLKTNNFKIDEIATTLTGKTFETKVTAENPNDQLTVEKYLTFERDTLITHFEYIYGDKVVYAEYQRQPYHFLQVNGSVFLSCNADNGNPQPIIQILDVGKNVLTIRSFFNRNEVIETMVSIEKPQAAANYYSNCFDGHIGEYYHNRTDVTFDQGNDFLIKMIGQDAPLDQGDGYIIIHFNINCKSQCGRPGVITMDKSYQSRTFSVAMINHILSHVMKLKDWPTSVSDQDYFVYKDVHAFLMFKIENGKITDLCP